MRFLQNTVVCLGLGVTLTGVLQAQPTRAAKSRNAQVATTGTIATPAVKDPAKADYVLDLRPILAKKELREGINVLTTTDQGIRIMANVVGGKVVDLLTEDSDGNPGRALTVAEQRKPEKREGSGSPARLSSGTNSTGDDDVHCWHCYDIKGKTHCYEIKCPWM